MKDNSIEVDTPCLEWWGTIHHSGYGVHTRRVGGKNVQTLAHRLIWQECFGDIPDGLLVRHKCDNPPCVYPEHLELGTHADNARDRVRRGRDYRAAQTHCINGHEFSEENTMIVRGRYRYCRVCHRDRQNRYYREKKAALR